MYPMRAQDDDAIFLYFVFLFLFLCIYPIPSMRRPHNRATGLANFLKCQCPVYFPIQSLPSYFGEVKKMSATNSRDSSKHVTPTSFFLYLKQSCLPRTPATHHTCHSTSAAFPPAAASTVNRQPSTVRRRHSHNNIPYT